MKLKKRVRVVVLPYPDEFRAQLANQLELLAPVENRFARMGRKHRVRTCPTCGWPSTAGHECRGIYGS